jgi:hypothetical protein
VTNVANRHRRVPRGGDAGDLHITNLHDAAGTQDDAYLDLQRSF